MSERDVKLAVLQTKLDRVHDDVLEIKGMVLMQNGRVRKLESRYSVLSGGLSLLAFLLGLGVIKLFA